MAAGDALCQDQIAFQGRIVADATHEIQNHFAVIKEYGGLIGDLLRTKGGDAGTVDRCRQITRDINERANRAAALVDTLNRFAHRGDTAVSTFRLEAVVEEIVALTQRTAAQRRISLSASHGRKIAELTNNPSLIQYLLHSLMAPWLDSLEEGARLTVSTSRGKGSVPVVEIEAKGATSEAAGTDPAAAGLIGACLESLGASMARESGRGGRQRILISVPSLKPSA